MTKASEMAKVSAKGGFHLLWGLVASTVISAAGTIYLANLLSSSEMGLYALAIAAPNLIGVFRDWGVNSAIIRYTAQYNSEKQIFHTKKILMAGLTFEVIAGIILTAISFLLSALFADLYNLTAITPLIQIVSITILINAFFTVAQSAFTGLERMELNSGTLVVQSIFKAVLVPGLVIMGLGVFGAVIGFTFAFLIAGVTATLLLWVLYRKLPKEIRQPRSLEVSQSEDKKREARTNIKLLLKFGLPLSIGAIIATFQIQFYTILMGIYVSTDLIGNYSLATTFVVLITFFATPVTTMLFPAFSKLDPQKDKESLKSVFQFSVKYAALFVVPMAVLVMSLSGPAVATLFGDKYTSTPIFLALLAITYLFTAFGSLSAGNFINGQGKTSFNLKLSVMTAAIGFPLSIILASQLGVIGIILTTLVAGLPSLLISLHWIKKHYSLTIDWASSAKIMFSSAIAGASAYALQSQLIFSSLINLLIGVIVFAAVLLPSILLTRTINQSDIENLRTMITSLGPINRILSPALNMIEKLLLIVNSSGGKPQSQLKTKETRHI
jgi:O-antigen/teichoic acid export membrane protein